MFHCQWHEHCVEFGFMRAEGFSYGLGGCKNLSYLDHTPRSVFKWCRTKDGPGGKDATESLVCRSKRSKAGPIIDSTSLACMLGIRDMLVAAATQNQTSSLKSLKLYAS
jgi:hypothetical protein